MGISGISNPSSYEEWQLLQAQKEKAQSAAAKTGSAEAAQIEAIGNESNGQTQETRTVSPAPVDTIEISSEGRAFQESQAAGNKPAPSAKPASKTEESESGDSSKNLTTLSEEELQKLVDAGTITQAEANAELARREADKATAAETKKDTLELIE